jgi:hypothetical protein
MVGQIPLFPPTPNPQFIPSGHFTGEIYTRKDYYSFGLYISLKRLNAGLMFKVNWIVAGSRQLLKFTKYNERIYY